MLETLELKSQSILDKVVEDLIKDGWSYNPGFLEAHEIAALASTASKRWEEGKYRQAGIGRGEGMAVRPEIRTDKISWIEESDPCPHVKRYLQFIEALRLAVNRSLFLGAFRFEAHFACFPPGSFYKRHLDCFQEQPRRKLTCLMYLSQDWSPEDGGVLRVYTHGERTDLYQDFLPMGGTLMVFLSEVFYHEVLPTQRERLSLTGWLCRSDGFEHLR